MFSGGIMGRFYEPIRGKETKVDKPELALKGAGRR